MLQQTQVSRVIPKYRLFLKNFPSVMSFHRASLRRVLRVWQGLGYNRRALHLKRLAAVVVRDHKGKLPSDESALDRLPGIGKGTAGAILAFAFNTPSVFLETNIRRTFIHFFFKNRRKVLDKEVLPLIEKTLDRKNPREWYSALMDYGAHLRSGYGGQAIENPNRRSAHYAKQSPFRSSNRELRGRILRLLTRRTRSFEELRRELSISVVRLRKATRELSDEGFVRMRGHRIGILTK